MTAAEREVWIAQHKAAIAAFCQKWQIAEFALVGAVLREDFDPERAVSVLVTFAPEAKHGLFSHIDMEVELAAILERRIDLVSRPGTERSRQEILRKASCGEAKLIVSSDDRLLASLVQAAQDIQTFLQDKDWPAFESDRLLQNAMVWSLVLIGKAADNLSAEFKAGQPDIPWDDLADHAQALLTDYQSVDLDWVWKTAKTQVPALRALTPTDLPTEERSQSM